MSVTQSETQIESNQPTLSLDEVPVPKESGAKFAPPLPGPEVTSRDPNTDNDDGIASVEDEASLITVKASVDNVRRGGKAPEGLGAERLDVNAQTDLGMLSRS
jgi:hypothetical protein